MAWTTGTRQSLYVTRERLPEAEDEETFYHADLVGLRADLTDGKVFGHVSAVLNHGAGDLLDIALVAGGSVLVPFRRETVPEVDIAAGRLVVDPPDGLLDGGARDEAEDAG
jgi:16S rRNA processing protein RimM